MRLQLRSASLPDLFARSAPSSTAFGPGWASCASASAKPTPPPTATTSSSPSPNHHHTSSPRRGFLLPGNSAPIYIHAFSPQTPLLPAASNGPVQTLPTETPQVIQNQTDCIQREPRTGARAPLSTYRLQLHAGFPF